MLKSSVQAFLLAGLMGVGLALPAHANVVYDLTFEVGGVQEGTGVLTLDFSTVAQAAGFSGSIDSVFVSLITTSIGNPDNLSNPTAIGPFDFTSSSDFSTATMGTDRSTATTPGKITSLTIEETEPSSDSAKQNPTNIPYLELFTGTFQVHGKSGSVGTEPTGWPTGTLVISGPFLVTTPLPSTWPLFAGGLALVAFLAWRRRHAAPRRSFAGA
jgi:hypothetical protein